MKIARPLLISLFVLAVSGIIQAQEKPRNIIIMISDGCGYNQIAAAKYYNGDDTLSYEKFPVSLAMSTFPSTDSNTFNNSIGVKYDSQKAWSDWNFVKSGYTGSAAAATAMASGVKSRQAAIGVDIFNKNLQLITEKAIESGKAAGVVTSVQFAHATPAGFSVHNESRNNYSEIANSFFLDSKLSVVMGCGHPMFDSNATYIDNSNQWDFSYVGGEQNWNALRDGAVLFPESSISGNNKVQDVDGDGTPDRWVLIEDKYAFESIAFEYEGPAPKRLIGVATAYQTLQAERGGVYDTIPFSVPLNENVPHLYEMALVSINVLKQDEDGFFLMIEGGAIDWAGHGNSLGRIIEEEIAFNRAVDSVISWIEQNGGWEENLLIVTGDHETGYLVGSEFDTLNIANTIDIIDNGKGNLPGAQFLSGNHTNQLIPFFAKGVSSELFLDRIIGVDQVRGRYIDNTEIGKVCLELLN